MGKEWLETLPEDLRGNPAIQVFEDVPSLAKSFIETKAKVGQKGIPLLAEGEKDQKKIDEYYTALGRPGKPEEYELPEGIAPGIKLPNGQVIAAEDIEDFKKFAFGMGMSKTAFNKTFGYQIDKMKKGAEAQATAHKTAVEKSTTQLRGKWGQAYDQKVQGVQKLVDLHGADLTDEDMAAINTNPRLLGMLGGLLDSLSEATIGEMGIAKSGTLTPDDAQAEIAKILADKTHPFNDPKQGKTNRDWVLNKMPALYAQAYPGKKKI